MDHIEQSGIEWEMDRIVGHQGPLNKKHPSHMDSPFNVEVLWSNGETTQEPLSVIACDAIE